MSKMCYEFLAITSLVFGISVASHPANEIRDWLGSKTWQSGSSGIIMKAPDPVTVWSIDVSIDPGNDEPSSWTNQQTSSEDYATNMPSTDEASTDAPTSVPNVVDWTVEQSSSTTVNLDPVPATDDWQSTSTLQPESSTILIPKKVGEIIYERAWPNGLVPYYVEDQNMNWLEKSLIQRAIEGLHRYTCVRFVPAARQDRPLAVISNQMTNLGLVSNDAIQCGNSPIGYQGSEGQYDIGLGCSSEGVGMVQHELMHLLGFDHEEQRPDRDQYLELFWDNICNDALRIINATPGFNVTSYPYDVDSVMQDQDAKGACNGSKKTMRDRQDRPLGRQVSLTAIDVQKINDVYQCGPISVPEPKPSGRPINPCTFDVDWCGYTQYYKSSLYNTKDNDTFADDFDWVRANEPVPGTKTPISPQQDHTGNGYHCIALSERHGFTDVAKIASPIFTSPDKQACLQFFWSMQQVEYSVIPNQFAHPFGQIDVILLVNGSEQIIYAVDRQSAKAEWTEALVDIPVETGTRFQIIFQAEAGATHISDMAIDDVSIYSTGCSAGSDQKNLIPI